MIKRKQPSQWIVFGLCGVQAWSKWAHTFALTTIGTTPWRFGQQKNMLSAVPSEIQQNKKCTHVTGKTSKEKQKSQIVYKMSAKAKLAGTESPLETPHSPLPKNVQVPSA